MREPLDRHTEAEVDELGDLPAINYGQYRPEHDPELRDYEADQESEVGSIGVVGLLVLLLALIAIGLAIWWMVVTIGATWTVVICAAAIFAAALLSILI